MCPQVWTHLAELMGTIRPRPFPPTTTNPCYIRDPPPSTLRQKAFTPSRRLCRGVAGPSRQVLQIFQHSRAAPPLLGGRAWCSNSRRSLWRAVIRAPMWVNKAMLILTPKRRRAVATRAQITQMGVLRVKRQRWPAARCRPLKRSAVEAASITRDWPRPQIIRVLNIIILKKLIRPASWLSVAVSMAQIWKLHCQNLLDMISLTSQTWLTIFAPRRDHECCKTTSRKPP